MPRPVQSRRVCHSPECRYFKPAGVPTSALEEVVVAMDELEALRLADVEGLYHEQAADRMRVSRRTFGRIIDSAHKKVAQALVQGMALRIEGGVIEMAEQRAFRCADCQHEWQLPFGTGRPTECPQCQGKNFHRAEEQRGRGGRCSRGGGSAENVSAAVGGSDGGQGEATAEVGPAAPKGRGRKRRRRHRAST